MARLGGDTQCISGFVDDNGAISFNIDVNGDFFDQPTAGQLLAIVRCASFLSSIEMEVGITTARRMAPSTCGILSAPI